MPVRVPAHTKIVEEIKLMIVEGELKAGGRLGEEALAARLGVSRAPLREALRVLTAEGALEFTQNQGVRVATVTEARFKEIMTVVAWLEQLVPEHACRNASDADILLVAEMHLRMLRFAALGDLSGYFRLNMRFHQMLVDLAGNPTLSETYKRLNTVIWRHRYLAHTETDTEGGRSVRTGDAHFSENIAWHEKIVEALRRRDAAAMRQAVAGHYDMNEAGVFVGGNVFAQI